MNSNELHARVAGIIDYMRMAAYPEREALLKDAKWLNDTAWEMGTDVLELRNLCLAAEIYDLCGEYFLAKAVIERSGDDSRAQLQLARAGAPELAWTNDFEKRLLRQRLWVVLHHGNALYRTKPAGEMEPVLEMFRECEETVDHCLPLERETEHHEPSYGLRSRIAYSQGVVYLRLEDIDTARQCFSRAMDLQQQRFDTKLKKLAENKKGQERRDGEVRERAYARYTAAKIFGLGLGWCSLRAGELLRGRAAIACARTMFEFCGDKVHKAFMELLYATTLRMQNRNADGRDLDKAIKLLQKASTVKGPFQHHSKYRSRALYELAFARLDRAVDDPEVDGLIAQVEELNRKGHEVLRGNARLLRSRKQRLLKLPEMALETAVKVQNDFKGNGKIFVRALVAKAEAEIDLEHFAAADEDLCKALTLARGNPLLTGVCHLHRARCLFGLGHFADARDQLARWRGLKPRIEDGSAIQLSNEVEAKILDEKTLWLSREETLNSDIEQIKALTRRRVLEVYHSEYGAGWVREAIKRLGLAKSQIHHWADEYGIPRPRDPRPGTPKRERPGRKSRA